MIRQRNMRWNIQGVSPYETRKKTEAKPYSRDGRIDVCLNCKKSDCVKGECEKLQQFRQEQKKRKSGGQDK